MIEPQENDALTCEILQVLFAGFALYSTRLLCDHLPGGTFHQPSGLQSTTETASVRKTNAICESDFGKLDRYLREKPNIQTVALEGLLMFSNNQTSQWPRHKSDQEREGPCSAIRATPEFA
eukprot:scpid104007/ scgid33165/ 